MQKHFLHYIWQHQKFDLSELKSVQGDTLEILHPGYCLENNHSCFVNAQLRIGNLRWAGSVFIEEKSSDWKKETCIAYPSADNLILLVVFEDDAKLCSEAGKELQVLELKGYIAKETLCESRSVTVEKIIKFVTVLWD